MQLKLSWVLISANIVWPCMHSATLALDVPKPQQDSDDTQYTAQASTRAAAIENAFQTAWDGYYKHAFPNDELKPVSNGFDNSRNGWGASAVDALSTAVIMQKPEVVRQILDYISTIDWSKSHNDQVVNLFETTIRYLGGLLSGYDLLSGSHRDLCSDQAKLQSILDQAANLANNLSFAFETPSGIPHNLIFLHDRTHDQSRSTGLASLGTLVLEWTRLADLTGNETYAELTHRAQSYLLNPQPPSIEPWPGLVGSSINISDGHFMNAYGSWGGGSDSFYEYLIKMFVYDSSRFSHYRDRWMLAADSTIDHLSSHPGSKPELTFLAEFNGTSLLTKSSHLACFDGGNFILGGLVLHTPRYVDFGLSLVTACKHVFDHTLTGVGPEAITWDINDTSHSLTDMRLEFYHRAGFHIVNKGYALRPEVLESFYYAYRATGDKKYQDWSWKAFQSIVKATRVGSGYAGISDVTAEDGGAFVDFQESFWFSEVLKYSYLIHIEDADYQVKPGSANAFVYSTEGHPIKVFDDRT